MTEDYFNKVEAIALVRYQLDKDMLLGYLPEIDQCYNSGFTPRRTVEVIASKILA